MIVAPHAGAWIETPEYDELVSPNLSLPMRERGLKLYQPLPSVYAVPVAPHAGAWIETVLDGMRKTTNSVAPHAGAWIETHV